MIIPSYHLHESRHREQKASKLVFLAEYVSANPSYDTRYNLAVAVQALFTELELEKADLDYWW